MTTGTTTTRDIVARLWNLCNILRDDGITYTDYVTELTFLLFLKMLAETKAETRLPPATPGASSNVGRVWRSSIITANCCSIWAMRKKPATS